MQNDEYLRMYEKHWRRILGEKDQTVTDEEKSELKRLIKTNDAKNGGGSHVS